MVDSAKFIPRRAGPTVRLTSVGAERPRPAQPGPLVKHRGTGFARPQVLPPAGGGRPDTKCGATWGRANLYATRRISAPATGAQTLSIVPTKPGEGSHHATSIHTQGDDRR